MVGIGIGISPGAGRPAAAAPSPVLDGLLGAWGFNGAANTDNETDASAGGHTLTRNGSPAAAAGKVSGARALAQASGQYFTAGDHADFEVGAGIRYWTGWVKFADAGAGAVNAQCLLAKYGSAAGTREYKLRYTGSAGTARLTWIAVKIGPAALTLTCNTIGPLAAGTWYFLECWISVPGNQIGVRVNRGSADTRDFDDAVAGLATDREMRFGADQDSDVTGDCALDAWTLHNRMLTSDELDALYNAGGGKEYPF